VNASRKPGQWQTYDVVFRAPRFEGDKLASPAYFTAFGNGVLVQDHTASLGPMKHRIVATTTRTMRSARSCFSSTVPAVRFRNIWSGR